MKERQRGMGEGGYVRQHDTSKKVKMKWKRDTMITGEETVQYKYIHKSN